MSVGKKNGKEYEAPLKEAKTLGRCIRAGQETRRSQGHCAAKGGTQIQGGQKNPPLQKWFWCNGQVTLIKGVCPIGSEGKLTAILASGNQKKLFDSRGRGNRCRGNKVTWKLQWGGQGRGGNGHEWRAGRMYRRFTGLNSKTKPWVGSQEKNNQGGKDRGKENLAGGQKLNFPFS